MLIAFLFSFQLWEYSTHNLRREYLKVLKELEKWKRDRPRGPGL